MRQTALLGIAALAACTPHKVVHNPAPPVDVPQSYGKDASKAPAPERWWKDLGDPDLEALVDKALAGNLQLRATWARLAQAGALAREASAGKWPQVQFDASAGRAQQRFNLPMIGQRDFISNSFKASVGAAYEVDAWNKIGSTAAAAGLEARAGRDDLESMAMSLTAQIAEAWYSLVELRAERALVAEQLRLSQTYLELVQMRFEQGLSSSLDVYQQEQQVTQLRGRMALLESAVETTAHGLAVLVGQPPRTVVAGDRAELPELPPLPGTGIPADLLERRPDVRGARKRVEAADYRVAAAIADRLPGLRLQGALSLSNSNLGDLIAKPLYSIVAAVTAPLLDGGRRKAEVDRTRAVVEERVWTYGQVLLQAMLEVDNALVEERQQKVYIGELEHQVEVSQNTLTQAQDLYQQGLTDYLPVLTALQVLQQSQVALLQARRQLISYRIQLCRALGGSWTAELRAPAPRGVR